MPGKLDGNKLALVAHKQQAYLKILLTRGYLCTKDDENIVLKIMSIYPS